MQRTRFGGFLLAKKPIFGIIGEVGGFGDVNIIF